MNERPFDGKRFLVAEDDPYSRRIVERILRQSGAHEVYLANDGIEAVQVATRLGMGIDCLVSDLNMKPMHGLYLLQAVRAGVVPLPRETPMVIVTGNASDHLLRYAIELDCNGFIAKPVSFEALKSRVARALTEHFDLREATKYAAIKLPDRILEREYVKINGIDYPVYAKPGSRPDRDASPQAGRPVRILDAAPGAVVQRDIRSSDGMLLLAPGVELNNLIISRLRDLAEMDPSVDTIWVDDV